MIDLIYSILVTLLLFAALGAGLWVGFSLLLVGGTAMMLFSSAPTGTVLATTVWGALNSWPLAALPMFIWMGEILCRSRLADDLFDGIAPWVEKVPGGLLHVNVLGSAIFAAVSGSSAATAATVGRVTLPELARRGYDDRAVIGSLAGASTLGFLIPPSIILIVYGVASNESIARLFLGGILPGLMLVVLFSGYVAFANRGPSADPSKTPMSLIQKFRNTQRILPVALLIAGVIGSIYFGIASPTDAAAIGVLISLLLSWRSGSLTRENFLDGLMASVRTSCMITFVLAGASFLSVSMGFAGIPRDLAEWIGALGLPPTALIAALTILFILLGCFLDGISIVVLTTSIILPMVEAAGINLIWFGIYLVIVVELSQITPPVGFNLFVIQGLTGKDILFVARSALPYFVLLLAAIALLTAFPEIATYLPEKVF